MNIGTYNLTVQFNGYIRIYYNISRVAVNRFISYHSQNPDYVRAYYGNNLMAQV